MGIMSTGVSGLMAFQRALATTSHNVSNSTKEGYSRQRVELEHRLPEFVGAGYIGQGVQVSNIRRIQDEFVDTQLRTHVSSAGNGEARAQYAERIDRLLGDDDTGLAPALGTFFNAANDVASDPTSTVSRTVFLSEAQSMVGRFNELNGRIEEQRELLNDQIKRNVSEINSIAEGLVALNQRIVEGYGKSGGSVGGEPNDLLDQRGQLLKELAEKIDIRTLEQDDRSINVFIGNGQPLVLGNTSNELVAESLSGDVRNWDIGFASGNGKEPVDITRFMSGGELGGLLDSRGKILDEAQNGIGQLAVVLSTLMNRQNNLGLDLDGNPGEDIFEIPQISVGADKYNQGSADYPKVEFTEDVFELTSSDYRLDYDGAAYQLVRLDDNKTFPASTGPVPPAGVIIADGIEVDTSAMGGPPAANDNWLIQPTRFGAQDIDMLMSDPNKVAAISGALEQPDNAGDARLLDLSAPGPITWETEIPAAVIWDSSNFAVFRPRAETAGGLESAAKVESFKILDSEKLLSPPPTFSSTPSITFRENYNATASKEGVDGFEIADGTNTYFVPYDLTGTTTISYPIDADPGDPNDDPFFELKITGKPADGDVFDIVQNTGGSTYNAPPNISTVAHEGWKIEVFGEPSTGDVFSVQMSKDRPGDNRNMLVMAGLAEDRVVEDSATFADSYNQVLGDIGTRTRQAQVFRDSSIALRDDAQAERDALSGVNLDEEAANLLKYQKAYQAAAQVISTGKATFDILFSAFR